MPVKASLPVQLIPCQWGPVCQFSEVLASGVSLPVQWGACQCGQCASSSVTVTLASELETSKDTPHVQLVSAIILAALSVSQPHPKVHINRSYLAFLVINTWSCLGNFTSLTSIYVSSTQHCKCWLSILPCNVSYVLHTNVISLQNLQCQFSTAWQWYFSTAWQC